MTAIKSKIFTLIAEKEFSKNDLNQLCLNYEREISKNAISNYIGYKKIEAQEVINNYKKEEKALRLAVLDDLTDTETLFYKLKKELKDVRKSNLQA